MADSLGIFQAGRSEESDRDDPERRKGLDELMARLRARCSQLKSWDNTCRQLRMSMTEKRHQSEGLDKAALLSHLESLQKAFKVTSNALMLERLESAARQVNLKFTQQSGHVFLSSEMFFLDLVLKSGSSLVQEVKITHHAQEPQNCPEMAECLNENKFVEFIEHLEGLNSIYQINVEKKLKQKALIALKSLEEDLCMLSKLQSIISGVPNYIHKSPLGILRRRVGGLSMKMTYFVGPYDLLNEKTQTSCPMTLEAIAENRLGYNLTVGIEPSTPHKLQTIPLMSVQKTPEGKSLPSFSEMNNINSVVLPAVFKLTLERPVPMAFSLVRKIQELTDVEFVDIRNIRPLMSLIVQQMTNGKVKDVKTHKGLFVSLPDQCHGYFMSGLNGASDLQGMLVSEIYFTHPKDVTSVIKYLRQQVLFNTVIGSCVRCPCKQDLDNSLTFEATPLSLQHITITFEHPLKDSIATAELDLTDITCVKCQLCTSEGDDEICSDDYATKVLQRCLSLPVTMRAIFKKAAGDMDLTFLQPTPPQIVSGSFTLSKVGQERRAAFRESMQFREEFSAAPPADMNAGYVAQPINTSIGLGNPSAASRFDVAYIDPVCAPTQAIEAYQADKVSKNPMLASLLDQEAVSPEVTTPPQPSMLSQLLGDGPNPTAPPPKQRKPRKRKIGGETLSPLGPSPKRKTSDEPASADCQAPPPAESDIAGTVDGMSQQSAIFHSPTSLPSTHNPNRALTSQAPNRVPSSHNLNKAPPSSQNLNRVGDDLYVQESHVSKLASSMDSILESNSFSASQPSELTSLLNEDDPMEEDDHQKKSEKVTHSRASSCSSLKNNSFRADSISRTNSLENIFKGVDNCSMDSVFVSTVSEPLNDRKGSHLKSIESESFDLGENVANPDLSLDGMTEKDDIEVPPVTEEQDKPLVVEKPLSGCSSKGANKLCSDKVDTKEVKVEDAKIIIIKEKKKEKKEIKEVTEERQPEKEKSLGIAMKLNTKEGTAIPILKESPHHKSESPREVLDLSRKDKVKEGKIAKISTPDRLLEPVAVTSDMSAASSSASASTKTSLRSGSSSSSSSSHRILTTRKSRGEEKSKSEKRRKGSRHGDLDRMEKKRRRTTCIEEPKKDPNLSKKQRIYDFDSEINESENYRIERQPQYGKPTKIKITTAGGKMQIQTTTKSILPSKSSTKSNSANNSPMRIFKTHNADKLSSPQSGRSGTNSRGHGRSRSDSSGLVSVSASSKMDCKLYKTPTIKLKPITLPTSSTTVTVTSVSTATRSSQSSSSSKSDVQSSASSASNKNKQVAKTRKGSLKAVIDKLTRQHSVGSSLSGDKDGDKVGSNSKKTAKSEKELYDEIRLAIVREGNKPSTPTKDMVAYKPSSKKMEQNKGDKAESRKSISSAQSVNSNSQKVAQVSGQTKSTSGISSKTPNSSASQIKASAPDANSKLERGKELNSSRNPNALSSNRLEHTPSKNSVEQINSVKPDGGDSKKDFKESHQSSHGSSQKSSNSVSGRQVARDGERSRKTKIIIDDSDRFQSRHFMDIVTKLNPSSSDPVSNSTDEKTNTPDGPKSVKGEMNDVGSHRSNDNHKLPRGRPNAPPGRPSQLPDSQVDSKSVKNNVTPSGREHRDHRLRVESSSGRDSSAHERPIDDARTSRSDGRPQVTNVVSTSVASSSSTSSSKIVSNQDAPKHEDRSKVNNAKPSGHVSGAANSSENKENVVRTKDKDDVFKAPTPKPAKAEDCFRGESSKLEKVRSKPVLSPRSDVSSPEDGLIIDCPGTPRAVPSPRSRDSVRSRSRSNSPSIPKSPIVVDSASKAPRSPSPRKPIRQSPVASPMTTKSPMMPRNSASSPLSHNSPCEIDDELMDAALML